MKKITICIVMALLCLNFWASGQENKASDVSLKGIQIGQKVPGVNITGLYNYRDADGKPSTTAKLSDFKGKLLILDFWATWCSPCVAMIPKMDSLQKAFGNKIQFLSVSYQAEKEVLPFLEKFEKHQGKNYDLPVVTGDKELNKLFPHTTLPHYIWIDGAGSVRAITEAYYVNNENISTLLSSGKIDAIIKKDVLMKYDRTKPLFAREELNGTILKQCTFSGYIDGAGLGYDKVSSTFSGVNFERITARNSTIKELFQYAYKKEFKEMIFEIRDSSAIFFKSKISAENIDWRKNGNAFCFELIKQEKFNKSSSTVMQEELSLFFPQYEAKIEQRKVRALVLVSTAKTLKIMTSGGKPSAVFSGYEGKIDNCPLTVFISRMQYFLQKYPLPLADETGYKEWVDLEIKANLSNVSEVNAALARYDLKFVEQDALMDMLVIRDKHL